MAGLAFVRGQISRHATIGTGPYFDDSDTDNALALVGGLDVGIPVTSHVYLVPTLRLLLTFTGTASTGPLESQTETGTLMIRYGAGVRVAF